MQQEFIDRTSTAWGTSNDKTIDLLATDYSECIRINPFRVRKSTLSTLKSTYKSLQSITWADDCFYIENEQLPPSRLPNYESGEYIIQNASSYIPALELSPQPNDNVLDMCAAPGIKSSHIASLSNNKAHLTLNDTSRTRFFKMRKYMDSLGVKADYSLKDGREMSKQLGADYFDKILLDAPCSGEANIDLNSEFNWNIATIKRLQSLQLKLINEAYKMLKPGGTLVYSTCTIAPEENEVVINKLLRQHPGAKMLKINKYLVNSIPGLTAWKEKPLSSELNNCLRLLPSKTCRPFFIAKLTKLSNYNDDDSSARLAKAYNK